MATTRIRTLGWLLPLLCLTVWLGFIPGSMQRSHRYSWDSAAYIEAAQSIVRGEGIMQRVIGGLDLPLKEPMSLWPPGFPLLIAAVHAFGLPAPEAGVLVSLIAGAVFVLLQAWICQRLLAWWMAIPVALATSCMPALYHVSTVCLSDAAYMALASGSLACLVGWVQTERRSWLLLAGAGLLAGGAWGTRNVGISLLAAEAAFVLLHLVWQPRRRVLTDLSTLLGAGALPIVPVLIRNVVAFGRLNAYAMPPSNLSLGHNLKAAFSSIRNDLLPIPISVGWLTPKLTIGILMIVVGLMIWRYRDLTLKSLRNILQGHAPIILLVVYASLFLASIIVARTQYWWGEPIYWRYLVPVYWILFIALAVLATPVLQALRMPDRAARVVLAGALTAIALGQAQVQLRWLGAPIPPNPLVAALGQSAVSELAANVPPHQIVLAGPADQLRIHLNLNARKIPSRPFSDAPYRREIMREDFERASRQGHLWGVVIDNVPGAREGVYGRWIQHLVTSPTDFPQMKRLALAGPSQIFQYVPERARPSTIDNPSEAH